MELNQLLQDEKGRMIFMEFLTREFSQENLDFWLECQQLKNMTDYKSIKKYAQEIYSKYISLNGPKSINIDSITLKNIKQNLDNPSADIFEKAERHIFDLMKNDSYSRFLKTPLFQNFMLSLNKESNFITRKRKSSHSIPSSQAEQTKNIFESSADRFYDPTFIFPLVEEPNLNCDYSYANTSSDHIYQNSQNAVLTKKWLKNQFIKIIFPDGTSESVSVIQQSTVNSVIKSLLAKKSLQNFHYKIVSIQDNKEIEPTRNIASLVMTDIRIERIINFFIHFPENYLVQVETNSNKLAYYTIQSILTQFGIRIDEVELTTKNGITLCKNSLIKSSSILDKSVICVNYLSSLRTYIDLSDFHDLNQSIEEGIAIKSVKFKKYKNLSNHKLCDSFSIDCNQKYRIKHMTVKESLYENVKNDVENVDIGNLSFSNEMKTDEFLKNMMISDSSRFKFTCNIPKQQQNYYENVHFKKKKHSREETQSNSLHHARLVFIDEPFYENNDAIKREKDHKQRIKKPQSSPTNIRNKHSETYSIQNSRSESPFTKYLLKANKNALHPIRKSKEPDTKYRPKPNLTPLYSPLRIKPDLVPTSKNHIKTLSKFHKFV